MTVSPLLGGLGLVPRAAKSMQGVKRVLQSYLFLQDCRRVRRRVLAHVPLPLPRLLTPALRTYPYSSQKWQRGIKLAILDDRMIENS